MRLAVLSIVAILFYLRFGPFPTAASVPVTLGLMVATLVTGLGALRRRRRHAALAFPILLALMAATIVGPVDVSVSPRAELGVRVVPVSYGLLVATEPRRSRQTSDENRGCSVPRYPKKATIQIGLAPLEPRWLESTDWLRSSDAPDEMWEFREGDRIAAASWAAVLIEQGLADHALQRAWRALERSASRYDGEPGLSFRDLYRAAPNQWGGADQAMDDVLEAVIRVSPAFEMVRRAYPGVESTSIMWITKVERAGRWRSETFRSLGAGLVELPPDPGFLESWLETEPVDLVIVDGDVESEILPILRAWMDRAWMDTEDFPRVILNQSSMEPKLLADQPRVHPAQSLEEVLLLTLEIAREIRLEKKARATSDEHDDPEETTIVRVSLNSTTETAR